MSKDTRKSKFATKAIHAGIEPDNATGAIMTPIYQTSTYVQEKVGVNKGFEYSRLGNPTRQALENSIATLENGKHGFGFSSGMAAIDAVLKLLEPGDEVISSINLYGGSYRIFKESYARYGIKFHFIDLNDLENLRNHINDNTRLIWFETPTNPLLAITDINAVADIAKEKDCFVAIDNTFATPYLQNPIDLGVDIIMHSATKYLSGHSDVIIGALVVNDDMLAEKLAFIQKSSGAICGPMDCFLVLRGIKTLHLRMQRHCENAKKIAEFLIDHSKVKDVYWPGLSNHPNHDIAKRQMRDYGGMVSFTLSDNSREAAMRVIEKVKIFSLAESLGGVESLIGHPASMTHASVPREEREKVGIVDSLIRLSVGVEDAEDLVADLKQALG